MPHVRTKWHVSAMDSWANSPETFGGDQPSFARPTSRKSVEVPGERTPPTTCSAQFSIVDVRTIPGTSEAVIAAEEASTASSGSAQPGPSTEAPRPNQHNWRGFRRQFARRHDRRARLRCSCPTLRNRIQLLNPRPRCRGTAMGARARPREVVTTVDPRQRCLEANRRSDQW